MSDKLNSYIEHLGNELDALDILRVAPGSVARMKEYLDFIKKQIAREAVCLLCASGVPLGYGDGHEWYDPVTDTVRNASCLWEERVIDLVDSFLTAEQRERVEQCQSKNYKLCNEICLPNLLSASTNPLERERALACYEHCFPSDEAEE